MQPEDRDPAYLWDMLEHARLAVTFTEKMHFDAYQRDRVSPTRNPPALAVRAQTPIP